MQNKKNVGYCYVVTNPMINDWVKIGFTKRKSKQRLKEYQTYSPVDYVLFFECEFENPIEAEREVHKRLNDICEKRKEWFKVSASFARNIIEDVREELDTWGKFEE